MKRKYKVGIIRPFPQPGFSKKRIPKKYIKYFTTVEAYNAYEAKKKGAKKLKRKPTDVVDLVAHVKKG